MGHPQISDFWNEATGPLPNGHLQSATGLSGSDHEGGRQAEGLVVIVDKRALERECLARGLVEHNPALRVSAVGSLEEIQRVAGEAEPSAILVILGARKVTDQNVRAELVHFISEVGAVPVIVVVDSDEPGEILAALECGARGYIPTSVKVKVAAEAIGLARAGGIFVPASCVLALREIIHSTANGARPLTGMFTAREAAVVEALRKGKANKIIAYELNLCESTVKVHIRNIMKKLKATNRTEVAYKLRQMML
ncbi:response regulator transcription factor [Mesorhizobium sp.]|uniref:LuxR C-terminal-related transcriptional regulator n=1 Tax=Mesorhizobium sp. TaxID=1871066 RepID=UPI000FE39BE6|nr:response regulator transcription factor [Mesorhizobium sp.]RWA77259.1 MAG: response regulator transcription factor [Mesorhizobium sp.]RWC01112.1 MAG: response regulator transcription factor [Mesorhizobium sp.]RWG84890.1 MAG: response regulator transcription factor [Mesorhizobium sp.]RWG90120.1 MAG: response regulator transcription factor [Mesorhizobium sp.]RWK05075.1 MAG: response regulator transcription factor [Mesorhizobium sp.]